MTTTYARSPRARHDHIVSGITTRCGLPLAGMATWPASMGSRVDFRPTCEVCRKAPLSPELADKRADALALIAISEAGSR